MLSRTIQILLILGPEDSKDIARFLASMRLHANLLIYGPLHFLHYIIGFSNAYIVQIKNREQGLVMFEGICSWGSNWRPSVIAACNRHSIFI